MIMDDYAFGIHSNIPLCCVREFVKYHATYELTSMQYGEYRWYSVGVKYDNRPMIGYVPCAACAIDILAKKLKPNKVHMCDSSCPTFRTEE